jgi:hypothetical protein
MIQRLRGLIALPLAMTGCILLMIAIKINPKIGETFMRVAIEKFDEWGLFEL